MDGSFVSDESDFYFSPLVIKDEDGNFLYRIEETQKREWNQQAFDLTQVPELKSPIPIDIPTNKSVYVDVEVWDYDGDTRDPHFVRSLSNLLIPFNSKNATQYWHSKTHRVSPQPNEEVSLKFKFGKLICDERFTGLGCSFCVEGFAGDTCSECAETSSFTCDEGGQRICKADYHPHGDCTVFCTETSNFTCNEQGQRICKDAYYPAGDCTVFCKETSSFTCDEQGQRICKDDYHPKGDCTVFCTETSGHTCNEEGGRICKEDHYPDGECNVLCTESSSYTCDKQGQKICKPSYYPAGSCTAFCENSLNYSCNESGFKVCNSHLFPEGNCSTFCQPKREYTCSPQGNKVCNDETADPEKDCKKTNIVVYAGIGGGVAVFFVLVSVITWLRRRKTKKSLETKDGRLEDDEVYDTLDVTLEHSALETKKEQAFSEKVDFNQVAVNSVKDKRRDILYSEYVDMNLEYRNMEADIRIKITEDTDVVYSTLDQKKPSPHAFQADPDDFLYSTLHGNDVINAPKGLPTTGMNGDGDTLYSTLHGKEDLSAKADSKPHGHDDADDDDNYDALFSNIGKREDDHLNVNADDVYAKLDRGNATCSNIHPTSPDRAETADFDYATSSEHDQKKDDNDDEPVYSVVNKEEVAIFNKRKDLTNSILYDHSTPDFPPSERTTFSAESDEVSGTVITDQNSAATYENQEQNLQDSLDDPSYLYSTVNK